MKTPEHINMSSRIVFTRNSRFKHTKGSVDKSTKCVLRRLKRREKIASHDQPVFIITKKRRKIEVIKSSFQVSENVGGMKVLFDDSVVNRLFTLKEQINSESFKKFVI